MRPLTIIPIYQESSFTTISNLLGTDIPLELVDFMEIYGGRAVRESIFMNASKKTYSINNYLPPYEVNTILQQWTAAGSNGILPFALEGSGSYICYSLQPDNIGEIVLSRVSGEDRIWFKPIAKTFEGFLNNLITPDEFQVRYFGPS